MHIEQHVRALRALNMRRRGMKLDEIAIEFGVSRERARQLSVIGAELERRMTTFDPWDELNARARNALTANGCEPTLDGVREFYLRETAHWRSSASQYCPSLFKFLMRLPNIGKKTAKEIDEWLIRHGKEISE